MRRTAKSQGIVGNDVRQMDDCFPAYHLELPGERGEREGEEESPQVNVEMGMMEMVEKRELRGRLNRALGVSGA